MNSTYAVKAIFIKSIYVISIRFIPSVIPSVFKNVFVEKKIIPYIQGWTK
jgi:hypothetical protein